MSGELGKALQLSTIRGKLVGKLVSAALTSGKIPGICSNEGCEFIVEVPERTETRYCTVCKTPTVTDLLTLCVIPEGAKATDYADVNDKGNYTPRKTVWVSARVGASERLRI